MLSYYKTGTVKESECTCAPCKAFWKSAFSTGADSISSLPWDRAENTAVLGNQKGLLKKGSRVVVDGKHSGVVQYVGLADNHLIAPDMHVGVHLYDNVISTSRNGRPLSPRAEDSVQDRRHRCADPAKTYQVYSTHNGTYKGKRFFHCPRGHGTMVKYSQVTPLPVMTKRELTGNPMFPSFDAVKKRRKEREKKIRDAEEQLKKEHQIKRQAQMEKLSAPPPPIISPRPTRASRFRTEPQQDKPSLPLQDEHDMGYQDYLEREKRREMNKPLDPKEKEEMHFNQMKATFGGDEKAERMAETLRKLHQGYEQGRIIVLAERE